MKTVTDCPLCKKDFMYDPNHDNLSVDLNNREELFLRYPVQDDIWPSRRWDSDHTDYTDLSGEIVICQDCFDKRVKSADVNVDGHILCAMRGCPDDANESKYCNYHYAEVYESKKYCSDFESIKIYSC